MRRRYRLLISVFVIIASIALVLAMILLSHASEGPIEGSLEAIANVLSHLEARVVRHVRGPGRAGKLTAIASERSNPDSLRHPGELMLGAYDTQLPGSFDGFLRIEESIGHALPLIQIYTAWGDKREQQFPSHILRAINDIGSIPVVTWEPWLTDFENRLHSDLPLRDQRERNGLAAVAAGHYDFYVDEWAREAARFGAPFLLRFAHEMNDPYRYPWGPQNNRTEDFVAAWQHVVQRFRAAGASNAVWVWSPHVAYAGFESFYPGDEFVDWVATGALNYGTVARWSAWWTFEQIFGKHYRALAAFGKPIMVAEFGTLAVGGSRSEWFTQALSALPKQFPAVKAVVFFNVPSDRTVTYQAVDWSIVNDSASVRAIRTAIDRW
jgi:hypothetical protein